METNNVNDLVISLNNPENNQVFNDFFANYIQKNKIEKLDDLKDLKLNALIKFLQEDEKGIQSLLIISLICLMAFQKTSNTK